MSHIFEAAAQEKNNQHLSVPPQYHAIVVGPPNAGKSSIVLRLMKKSEDRLPKPCVSIDYLHDPKQSDAAYPSHFWEISGDLSMKELVRVVLNDPSLGSPVLFLVLDLTSKTELFQQCSGWLEVLYQSSLSFVSKSLAKKSAGVSDTHPDSSFMRPIPFPVVVVGNKFDDFEKDISGERRIVAHALRFLSHTYGAGLVFTSRDTSLGSKLRAFTKVLLSPGSGESQSKTVTDSSKPLFILPGKDSFSAIGVPKTEGKSNLEKWAREYGKTFDSSSTKGKDADAFSDLLAENAAEDAVDQAVAAKMRQVTEMAALHGL